MKRVSILLLILVLAVSIVFAGFGCKQESAEAVEAVEEVEQESAEAVEEVAEEATEEEKIVLNWWDWENPGLSWQKLMQEEYMKLHPNIEFVIHQQDQYKIRDTFGPALTAQDKTLDCGHFYYGAVTKPLADAGLLMDLTPYFEKYGWYDILFKGADNYTFNDKPYVLNAALCIVPMIWYNTEMFADAGVEPPETMDELLEVCNTLKDAGYDTIVAGFQTQWPLQHLFNQMCINYIGGDDWATLLETTNTGYNGNMKWTDSRIADAMLQIKWLHDNGILSERCFSLDFPGSRGAIQGFEASMLTDGSWNATWLAEETEGKLKADYFLWPDPTPDEVPYKLVGTSDSGYVIPHYSEDKADIIAEYYDFLLQKESQLKSVEMTGNNITTYFTDEELEDVWNPISVRIFNQDLEKYGFGEISDIWLTPEFIEIMTTKVQEVVLGTTDVNIALQELEDLAADIRTR